MNPQILEAGKCSLVAEALRSWGVLKLRARGVSMLPTVWPGDLLTIQSHRPAQAEPGEIVLYMRRGRFFIHRVVSKSLTGNEIFLTTRGDCLAENDPPVRGRELLGKIIEVERAGSRFSPPRKLSPFRRMLAYVLCHWSLVRRAGLRLWAIRNRGHRQNEGTLVEAAT